MFYLIQNYTLLENGELKLDVTIKNIKATILLDPLKRLQDVQVYFYIINILNNHLYFY
jgi:hypothetical protein